jgi:3-hydroxy-9,10-secoandrosta-1,3,5(10)-triene-9,17-dione monooxygenase
MRRRCRSSLSCCWNGRGHSYRLCANGSPRPEATLQDAADAGILSLLVPRSRGGAAGGLAEYVELLRILASGDPSVAWTLGFFTAHNWLLGRWPAEAQEEFFGNGCPTRMAGVANPPGRAEATAGGYLVTGYWATARA